MRERERETQTDNPPPEELSKEGVQYGKDEVHEEEAVQLLSYKTLPALTTTPQQTTSISTTHETPVITAAQI